jgi:hypothetical protein
MKHQTKITLNITWDDEECSNPKDWDWVTLLDLPDHEDVEVIET